MTTIPSPEHKRRGVINHAPLLYLSIVEEVSIMTNDLFSCLRIAITCCILFSCRSNKYIQRKQGSHGRENYLSSTVYALWQRALPEMSRRGRAWPVLVCLLEREWAHEEQIYRFTTPSRTCASAKWYC